MARDAPSIDAYGDGGFRLSGEWHAGSLLILDDQAQAWPVAAFADLTPGEPGAGVRRRPRGGGVPAAGRRARATPSRRGPSARPCWRPGSGLEFMDTPAAARLYNVLTPEGRRVAAALIAV